MNPCSVGPDNASRWAGAGGEAGQCGVEDIIYDSSVVASSLVREYSLVCSRAGLRTLVNLTYMMGRGTYTVSYHLLSYVWMSLDNVSLIC